MREGNGLLIFFEDIKNTQKLYKTLREVLTVTKIALKNGLKITLISIWGLRRNVKVDEKDS